jgi:hypothetical protein
MEKIKKLAHTLNPSSIGNFKLNDYLKKEDTIYLPPISPVSDYK